MNVKDLRSTKFTVQFKLRSKLLKIPGFIYPTSKGLNDLFLNILWLKPLTHGMDNNNWGIKNILLKLKFKSCHIEYQASAFLFLSKVLSLWRNLTGIFNLKKCHVRFTNLKASIYVIQWQKYPSFSILKLI